MTETGKRRPWWAAALAGGFGAVLGTGALLGFAGSKTHEPATAAAPTAPVVAVSSPALPPGTISLDERLRNIETQLKTLGEDMAEVKRRLPEP